MLLWVVSRFKNIGTSTYIRVTQQVISHYLKSFKSKEIESIVFTEFVFKWLCFNLNGMILDFNQQFYSHMLHVQNTKWGLFSGNKKKQSLVTQLIRTVIGWISYLVLENLIYKNMTLLQSRIAINKVNMWYGYKSQHTSETNVLTEKETKLYQSDLYSKRYL